MNNAHLEKYQRRLEATYDKEAGKDTMAGRSYRALLAKYYNLLIPQNSSVLQIGCADGELLSRLNVKEKVGITVSEKEKKFAHQKHPEISFYKSDYASLEEIEELKGKTFDIIIVSESINYAPDVQLLLEKLHVFSGRDTRIILNFFNSLWKPLLNFANSLKLRRREPQNNWLSKSDVTNLLALSDWDLIKVQPKFLIPVKIPLFSDFLNTYFAPFFGFCCWTIFSVARSMRHNLSKEYSVSVVIPARNEMGNIEAAVERTPLMGSHTEIIFIEGNSTDQTWGKIQDVQKRHPDRDIKIMQQSGKGKGNAVREAYAKAQGEILMILDADLTVPPEELPKFYKAVASGHCDYANGVRLVYPMEKEAMRFLNMCGNKFFSLAFSWVLGQSIKDTLCGTKVMRKSNYEKIAANRSYFGDFDPFGDFDLIFGSAKLNLKFADIPIRYRDRTYGDTNISRWSHGWLLLKMVAFSLRKIKFV